MDDCGRLVTWMYCQVSYALLAGGSLRPVGNVSEMAFVEKKMRSQCQAGVGSWGPGAREEVAGTGRWSSFHPCTGGHSALTGNREVHLQGLAAFPEVFSFWVCFMSPGSFKVHPLESRMLNLLPSPCSTQVTCIVLEAQLFH